jgi:hypothetical protein
VLEIWSQHPWIAGHESSGGWPFTSVLSFLERQIGVTVDSAHCEIQNAFVILSWVDHSGQMAGDRSFSSDFTS